MSVRAGAPGGARAPRALVESAPTAQPPAPALDAFGPTAHRPLHQVLTAGLAAADFPEPAPTAGGIGMVKISKNPSTLKNNTFKLTVLNQAGEGGHTDMNQPGKSATLKGPGDGSKATMKKVQEWYLSKDTVDINSILAYEMKDGKYEWSEEAPDNEAPWWDYLRTTYVKGETIANSGVFTATTTCVDLYCTGYVRSTKGVLIAHQSAIRNKTSHKVMHRKTPGGRLEWTDFPTFFTNLWTYSTGTGSMLMTCYLIGYMMKQQDGAPYGMYNYTHNAGHHDDGH